MFSLQQTLLGRRLFDRRIYLFVFAIVGLFVFDAIAVHFSWYWTYQWLDIPVHIVAGLLVSLLMYYLVFANSWTARRLAVVPGRQEIFSAMVFWVLVIAISWEIVEFIGGRTYLSPKFATDLFVDIVVTCVGALVGYTLITRFRT